MVKPVLFPASFGLFTSPLSSLVVLQGQLVVVLCDREAPGLKT